MQARWNAELMESMRGAPAAHRLMAHSDANNGVVTRGALIRGGPFKWRILRIGVERTFLRSDGENCDWEPIEFLDLPTEARGWTDDGTTVRLTTITDDVGIGTASPHSRLQVAGALALAYTSTSGNLTLDKSHSTVAVDTTGGNRTITLPTAVGIAGRLYTVKRITGGTNTLTIATTGGQTIDGDASLLLPTHWSLARLQSDGANWLIV